MKNYKFSKIKKRNMNEYEIFCLNVHIEIDPT